MTLSPSRTLYGAVLLALVVATGCAGSDEARVSEETTARRLYAEGVDALASGDDVAAATKFNEVAQFPRFMKYAALGRLRLGDALFSQGRHLEAMEVYEEFVALYPNDTNVPYARYMSARAVHARMPGDIGFLSPAERLDPSRVLQARDRLRDFIATNPESPYVEPASELLADVRHRLFRHHQYVADFYARRDAHRAEAGRRSEMLFGYPEWGANRKNVERLLTLLGHIGDEAWSARVHDEARRRFPAIARISHQPPAQER